MRFGFVRNLVVVSFFCSVYICDCCINLYAIFALRLHELFRSVSIRYAPTLSISCVDLFHYQFKNRSLIGTFHLIIRIQATMDTEKLHIIMQTQRNWIELLLIGNYWVVSIRRLDCSYFWGFLQPIVDAIRCDANCNFKCCCMYKRERWMWHTENVYTKRYSDNNNHTQKKNV